MDNHKLKIDFYKIFMAIFFYLKLSLTSKLVIAFFKVLFLFLAQFLSLRLFLSIL